MPSHQQFQQFVENLISLKNHYQALLAEYENKVTHLREQMSHVNALLVEQLVENQHLIQGLIELRSHYQALHEQQQQKAVQIREHLAHVNALLADQVVWQSHQLVSIQAATLDQTKQQVLKEAKEPPSSESPQEIPQPIASSDTQVESEPQNFSSTTQQQEPEAVSDSLKESELRASSVSTLKTRMLPEYQHLTKTQAVEKLLQEHEGSILHVDYIIRLLYGELDADAIKGEKPRMYDTLSNGTEKGLWEKVPGQASCYTIDLKLVEPEVEKKTAGQNTINFRRQQHQRGKRLDEMLPHYQHLNLTAAVESVVQENPGQILTTDKVARELFGELEGRALTKAKDKIGKTLWGGAKQGRWQRVPGRLGCYTLDLSKVK